MSSILELNNYNTYIERKNSEDAFWSNTALHIGKNAFTNKDNSFFKNLILDTPNNEVNMFEPSSVGSNIETIYLTNYDTLSQQFDMVYADFDVVLDGTIHIYDNTFKRNCVISKTFTNEIYTISQNETNLSTIHFLSFISSITTTSAARLTSANYFVDMKLAYQFNDNVSIEANTPYYHNSLGIKVIFGTENTELTSTFISFGNINNFLNTTSSIILNYKDVIKRIKGAITINGTIRTNPLLYIYIDNLKITPKKNLIVTCTERLNYPEQNALLSNKSTLILCYQNKTGKYLSDFKIKPPLLTEENTYTDNTQTKQTFTQFYTNDVSYIHYVPTSSNQFVGIPQINVDETKSFHTKGLQSCILFKNPSYYNGSNLYYSTLYDSDIIYDNKLINTIDYTFSSPLSVSPEILSNNLNTSYVLLFTLDGATELSFLSVASTVSTNLATQVNHINALSSLQDIQLNNVNCLLSFPNSAFMNAKSLKYFSYNSYFNGYTNNDNTFTYIGSNAFSNCSSLTDIFIDNIHSINSQAFSNCSNLNTITLHNVQSIDGSAFLNCTSLQYIICYNTSPFNKNTLSSLKIINNDTTEVYINPSIYFNNVSSFPDFQLSGTNNITDIYFNNCGDISDGFCYQCSNLKNIGALKCNSIGASAFMNCTNLAYISNNIVTEIKQCAFYGVNNIELTSSIWKFPFVNYIGASAFMNCSTIYKLLFTSLQIIEDAAFANCTSLENITCSSVEYVSPSAFYKCSSLCQCDIPYIELYRPYVFANCSSLTAISYQVGPFSSHTLRYIGQHAFDNCYNLKTNLLNLDSDIASSYGENALVFESLTSINSYAFQNCSSFEKLYLNNSSDIDTITINSNAFINCYTLTSINISFNSECSINNYAFKNCTSLKYVEFNGLEGSTITIYGNNNTTSSSFYNSTSMTSATLANESLSPISFYPDVNGKFNELSAYGQVRLPKEGTTNISPESVTGATYSYLFGYNNWPLFIFGRYDEANPTESENPTLNKSTDTWELTAYRNNESKPRIYQQRCHEYSIVYRNHTYYFSLRNDGNYPYAEMYEDMICYDDDADDRLPENKYTATKYNGESVIFQVIGHELELIE